MGTASRHFDWSEFACKCANPACAGKEAHVDRLLIVGLEELHELAATRLTSAIRILISWNDGKGGSGCRCREHDMAVRHNDSTGQHAEWRAADIRMERRPPYSYNDGAWVPVHPTYVAQVAEQCPVWHDGKGGIGIYDSWVHLDVRTGPGARWRG